MDSVPMVAITGQVPRAAIGRDAFQETDITGITLPVTKHNYLVMDVRDIAPAIKEAFYIARTGRPGPVLIDVPKDVLAGEKIEFEWPAEVDLPGYNPPGEPDARQVRVAAHLINQAERPVILAGHGVLISRAWDELRELAEKAQIPVITTLLGIGSMSTEHVLNMGMPGMHGMAYASLAIDRSDLVIALGARFDDRVTGRLSDFAPGAKIIHVDVDATEFNKNIVADAPVLGDLKDSLRALIPMVQPNVHLDWIKETDTLRAEHPSLFIRKSDVLLPQQVMKQISDETNGEAIIVTGVGQHQMWAAQFYLTDHPDNWLSSGGAGSMGFGFPAAIGAQFGRPDDLVLAIVGDGGFQMTMCELATACIHKLPLKVIVLNNHYLGMVRQWQELFYDERESGVDLEGNPDFAKLAQSFGAMGLNLRRPGDVRKVLTRALEYDDGPVLINAEVEKADNVYPMIPSGQPLETMIIDRPTTKLAKPVGST
jgi:acetolactate synthase-1/2/3 large subunit